MIFIVPSSKTADFDPIFSLFSKLKKRDKEPLETILKDSIGLENRGDLEEILIEDANFDISTMEGFEKLSPHGKAVVLGTVRKVKKDRTECQKKVTLVLVRGKKIIRNVP